MKVVEFYTPDEKTMPLGTPIVCVTEEPWYGDLNLHQRVIWSELAYRESTAEEIGVDGYEFSQEDREELMEEGFSIDLVDMGSERVSPERVRYWAHLVQDLGLDDE